MYRREKDYMNAATVAEKAMDLVNIIVQVRFLPFSSIKDNNGSIETRIYSSRKTTC